MIHGNDLVIRFPVFQVRILARRLDGALHSLRAAVRKEHAIHAGDLFEFFRRLDGGRIVIVV